jgi:hypothetical protein
VPDLTHVGNTVREDGTARTRDEGYRVLFCLGVLQPFYDADESTTSAVKDALITAYDDLKGRFGVNVLGTIDDDELIIGPTTSWPWTCYILADVPSVDTAMALCNLIRQTRIGDQGLWRYIRIEARVGRRLFFGNA